MLKKYFFAAFSLLSALAVQGLEIADRPGKVTKEIHFFPQQQPQYGYFQNFVHHWFDRPLYINKAFRYEGNKFVYGTEKSILKHMEIAQSYNVAGLSSLSKPKLTNLYYDVAEKYDLKDFMLMASVYLPGGIQIGASQDQVQETIRRAIASPKSFRVNGKVVVNSYESATPNIPPENVKKYLDNARKNLGDKFLFVIDAKMIIQSYYLYEYDPNRKSPDPAKLQAMLDKIQSYLDVTDGLYIGFIGRKSAYNEGREYGTKFDEEFFNYIKPHIIALLNKPQNRGKLFGTSCLIGYMNYFTGMVNPQEYGTESFRKMFEAAISYNPDFIIAFEWNEWNENTCFSPTVYKGETFRRIIRYYQSLYSGRKLEPVEGDDHTIPNMVLSYRYLLKLGEVMRFEFLNIPDNGKFKGNYTVQLTLKDIKGKTLHTFSKVTLNANQFKAQTFTLPSEKFADNQVIVPEFTVTDSKGKTRKYTDNLYIRLTPTETRNYQYIRVALREIADVKVSGFAATRNPDGTYRVRGKIRAAAPMASAELLDNRDELRALGEKPEFDQDKYVIIQMTANAVPGPRLWGKLEMQNVSSCITRGAKQDGNHEFFQFEITPKGANFKGAPIGLSRRRIFFAVPRAEADKAVLKSDMKNLAFSIPVRDVMKYGSIAREFNNRIFLRFDRFEVQPDIPERLNKKEIDFDINVRTQSDYPIFHIRTIGMDRRLYRTKPIQVKFASGEKTELPVWSETDRKIVKVNVSRDRIPDIRYIFDPARGAILGNSYAPRFDAENGGGYRFYQTFNSPSHHVKGAKTASAKWSKDENGADTLKFDGIMSNLTFEPETFPRGAFTFECEFKPEGKGNMAIFRHCSVHPGSLGVFILRGKLYVNFLKPDFRFKNFPTKLAVQADKWNTLKITSDIDKLTITLNGQKQVFSKVGRGGIFRGSCFGGPVRNFGTPSRKDTTMYKGELRKLRIYHNCEQ